MFPLRGEGEAARYERVLSEREREKEEVVSASIMAGSRALGQHNVCVCVCESRSLERPPLHGTRAAAKKNRATRCAMRDGWK